MLRIISNLGNSGLQSWFIQRLTAIILALYFIFLLGFWFIPSNQHHIAWQRLYSYPPMKLATIISLVALVIHAWIGVWTVTTDYFKTAFLRFIVQIALYSALICYLIWGFQLLWP